MAVLIGGCERKGKHIPTDPSTIVSNTTDGWAAFEDGDYEAAIVYFNDAKNRDASSEEAYSGLGWAYSRDRQFIFSYPNFGLLLSLTEDSTLITDAYAGLAFTYSADPEKRDDQEGDSLAIRFAREALSLDPDYQFSHDQSIDAVILHALIAQSFYNRMDYLQALREVDSFLAPGFITDLINDNIIIDDSDTTDVLRSDPLTGVARLSLPVSLVNVSSVSSLNLGIEYALLGFEQGGGGITIQGNPIPQKGDAFLVNYMHAGRIFLVENFDTSPYVPPTGWNKFQTGAPNDGWEDLYAPTGDVDGDTVAYSGDHAAFHNNVEIDSVIDWLVSPQIDLSGAEEFTLKFLERNYNTTDSTYKHHGVWISTGSGDPAVGDFVELAEYESAEESWTPRWFDLSPFGGQLVYVAFRYECDEDRSDEWFIDDVEITTSLFRGYLTRLERKLAEF